MLSIPQFLLQHGGGNGGGGAAPNQPPAAPATPPLLLHRLALAHMDLWLLRRQLQLLTPHTTTPTAVDAAMLLLRSACSRAAALAHDLYDTAHLEAACTACRRQLDFLVAQRALMAASEHQLELDASGRPVVGTLLPPAGVIPAPDQPSQDGEGLAAARARAAKNLGTLPLPPAGGCGSFRQLLALMQGRDHPGWEADPRIAGHVAVLVKMRSVERELFRRAVALGAGVGGGGAAAGRLEGGEQEVAALEAVVDGYRTVVQQFLATEAGGHVMRAELLSREVLVVWAAYCLTHEAAGREHPQVLRYGVLGQQPWEGQRHLVPGGQGGGGRGAGGVRLPAAQV